MAKYQYRNIQRSKIQDYNANIHPYKEQYYQYKSYHKDKDAEQKRETLSSSKTLNRNEKKYQSSINEKRIQGVALSEYELKMMYEEIKKSVYKERQEYYRPMLERLVEKQYLLYLQALRAGIEIPLEITHSFVGENREIEEIKMETATQDPSITALYQAPIPGCSEENSESKEAHNSKNEFLTRFERNICLKGYTLLDMLYTREEVCCASERDKIFTRICQDFRTIATNPHGTRVIQCILSYLHKDQLKLLLKIICENLYTLGVNEYSYHVLLRLFERLHAIGTESLQKLVDALQSCIDKLLLHPLGVKIISKIMYICSEKQKQPIKVHVLKRLRRDSKMLYKSSLIFREIYENGNVHERSTIFQVCLPMLAELSCHAPSAHLLDSLLSASKEEKMILASEICTQQFLSKTVNNQQGVLVVRKLVDLLEIPDLVLMFVQLKQLKSPLALMYEITEAFKKDLLSKLNDQSIIDIASRYLVSSKQYARCKQAGVSEEKLNAWMLAIFKGDNIDITELDECILLIKSLNEVASHIADNNIGILRICLADLIKQIIEFISASYLSQ